MGMGTPLGNCQAWGRYPGLYEEGECRQLEFWAGKGANIEGLFWATLKVLKLHGIP